MNFEKSSSTLSYRSKRMFFFIGPESDHCLPLSVTHWLTHWKTDSCLVNLIDVTLACEDANSKLVDVVTVADEDRVGNNLLQISKLRFGQKAKLLFRLWAQGLVKILKLRCRQDLKLEFGQFFLLVEVMRLNLGRDSEILDWFGKACHHAKLQQNLSNLNLFVVLSLALTRHVPGLLQHSYALSPSGTDVWFLAFKIFSLPVLSRYPN